MKKLILMVLVDSVIKPLAQAMTSKLVAKTKVQGNSREHFESSYGQEVFAYVIFDEETQSYKSYNSLNTLYADKLNEAWFNYQFRSNIK